jgi:hypothetical protein
VPRLPIPKPLIVLVVVLVVVFACSAAVGAVPRGDPDATLRLTGGIEELLEPPRVATDGLDLSVTDGCTLTGARLQVAPGDPCVVRVPPRSGIRPRQLRLVVASGNVVFMSTITVGRESSSPTHEAGAGGEPFERTVQPGQEADVTLVCVSLGTCLVDVEA